MKWRTGRIREVDRRPLTLSWITSLCSRKRFILHHNSVDTNITVISHNSSQNIRWLQQTWNMAAKKSPYRGLNPGFWCRGRPCRAAAAGTETPGVGGTTECHSFSPEMRTTCSETWALRHGRLHCCRPHASAALNTHRHTQENSYKLTDTSEIQTLNYESVQ